MKKRLLITSIVMMLVVAVALSTATYAWFTSNDQVTASTVNITAATSDGSALGIGWSSGTASTYIVANNASGAFKPMAPLNLTNDTTTDSVTFYTATTKSEGGIEVFNNDVKSSADDENPIAPYTFTDGTDTSFYIKNLSTANAVSNVTVSATFGAGYKATADSTYQAAKTYYTKNALGNFVALVAGTAQEVTDGDADYTVNDAISGTVFEAVANDKDGSGLVRIAIFVKESTDSNYKLKGVLSKTPASGDTTIANDDSGVLNIVANNATADCDTITSVSQITLTTAGLDANNAQLNNASSKIDIKAIVWYDGVVLNDNTAGSAATVALTFRAV